jgi:hypothetical protein
VKLKAADYWIGVITGNAGRVAAEHYDPVFRAEDYNSNNYADGPSNPFGDFKHTNERMSLYGVLAGAGGQTPSATVEKLQRIGSSGTYTKSELTAKVGETVDYEIVATNTGETTLSLSNFADAKCTKLAGGASSLEAGKSTTWTCEHKLTETGNTRTSRASKRTKASARGNRIRSRSTSNRTRRVCR